MIVILANNWNHSIKRGNLNLDPPDAAELALRLLDLTKPPPFGATFDPPAAVEAPVAGLFFTVSAKAVIDFSCGHVKRKLYQQA